jgi:tRNA uridine 5-carboxymethylaminomethyl modification enzyme
MFTSRAEYRLSLRADNADQRLTPEAIALGCVSTSRTEKFAAWLDAFDRSKKRLTELWLTPNEGAAFGLKINQDGQRRTAYELLSYAEHSLSTLSRVWPELNGMEGKLGQALEIDAKYAVYMDRQSADIVGMRREESRVIPTDFDFSALPGLSIELQQKLQKTRPLNLAQAMKVDGMTPSAASLLLAIIRKAEVVSTMRSEAKMQ